MNEVLIAGGIMLGVASFFGLVLATANRYLRVEEDPRIEMVEGMLPGTNCGAGGQPGCHAFAEALVEGGSKWGRAYRVGTEGKGPLLDDLVPSDSEVIRNLEAAYHEIAAPDSAVVRIPVEN